MICGLEVPVVGVGKDFVQAIAINVNISKDPPCTERIAEGEAAAPDERDDGGGSFASVRLGDIRLRNGRGIRGWNGRRCHLLEVFG